MCLIAIHISSLMKWLFKSFARQSLAGLFVFLFTFDCYRNHTRGLKVCGDSWETVVAGCVGPGRRSIHRLHLPQDGCLHRESRGQCRWGRAGVLRKESGVCGVSSPAPDVKASAVPGPSSKFSKGPNTFWFWPPFRELHSHTVSLNSYLTPSTYSVQSGVHLPQALSPYVRGGVFPEAATN